MAENEETGPRTSHGSQEHREPDGISRDPENQSPDQGAYPEPTDTQGAGLMGPGHKSLFEEEQAFLAIHEDGSDAFPEMGEAPDSQAALSGGEGAFAPEDLMGSDSKENGFPEEFSSGSGNPGANSPDDEEYDGEPEIGFIVIEPSEDQDSGNQESDGPETPEYAPDPDFQPLDASLVSDRLSLLSQQVEQLGRDFESKLKYDSHKEKIIDSLHRELQEHKDGLLKKHMQSMVMDIVKVIDDVRKIVRYYREKELQESDLPKLLDILEDLPSDLEDAFSFQGIRPYTCEGNAFNPARQRVLQKLNTEDESLDKSVAKRLLPGYEWDDNILRLEMVGVYTYKPVSEND
ncbi:MAG: nucleotide exchange factor GrpE [Desulfatibacillum sp.]|nr:nucleotide exchange factor GrpE [Desulfatibacillum sp.]